MSDVSELVLGCNNSFTWWVCEPEQMVHKVLATTTLVGAGWVPTITLFICARLTHSRVRHHSRPGTTGFEGKPGQCRSRHARLRMSCRGQ